MFTKFKTKNCERIVNTAIMSFFSLVPFDDSLNI